MTRPGQHRVQNDLLRWYLLLWVCLAALWGLFEISNRVVSAAWSACSLGNEAPEICAQLKEHLGIQGQPNIASLPTAVLVSLLQQAIATFLCLLALYGILLWAGLSTRKAYLLWPILSIQGLLACTTGFLLPALSIVMPVSLLLVLILEACAIFKQSRTVLVFSGVMLICFLLTALLAWKQGRVWDESSLSIAVALILLVAGFLFLGGFFLLYTRLAHLHATIETAYARLEQASAHIEELTLVTERQRMARELHDTLAQGLAGIILQLGVIHAHARARDDDSVQVLLAQTLATARETLANARSAIDDLRVNDPALTSLVAVVQTEAQHFTFLTGIPCTTEPDLLSLLAPEHGEHVIGVIRESLTNVARHAHARQAWVRVFKEKETVLLEIGDNGSGFDPALAAMQSGHYGLLGLRERARLADAQLTVLSAPGQGTSIQLRMPVQSIKQSLEKK
ncbi:MAG TPA: sensor histidine kinase [Ktedonobacteraceae bacterium]